MTDPDPQDPAASRPRYEDETAERLVAPAALRNAGPIAGMLKDVLAGERGEHAVAPQHPHRHPLLHTLQGLHALWRSNRSAVNYAPHHAGGDCRCHGPKVDGRRIGAGWRRWHQQALTFLLPNDRIIIIVDKFATIWPARIEHKYFEIMIVSYVSKAIAQLTDRHEVINTIGLH